jgi:predicted GNAT family acetyltransferase
MIEHDAAARRFVQRLDAGDAYLSYTSAADGTLDLQHTIVPEGERGQGVGESLVSAAMAHAREQGVRIVPSCPFVQSWLDEHPEARDLVSDDSSLP